MRYIGRLFSEKMMNVSATAPHPAPRRLLMPKAPVLVLDGHKLVCLTLDGELTPVSTDQARDILKNDAPIVCNAPHLAKLLKTDTFHTHDVLALFAFVYPGRFAVPTPRGLARALHLFEPQSAEDACMSLRDSIRHLLTDLGSRADQEKSDPAAIASLMGLGLAEQGPTEGHGWPWSPYILSALGRTSPATRGEIKTALKIWDKLPEWAVHAPPPPAGHLPVETEEAHQRLDTLVSRKKEARPQQHAFTQALLPAFSPRNHEQDIHVVLAEAGTGTGKTMGYLAPATVWAEKNQGPVWISTYTRNLQRQVESELDHFYSDAAEKSRKVVVRKGRENYLCLLNLEDATQSQTLSHNPQNAVAVGLMLRWAAITSDGDIGGKDFPGWLQGLVGINRLPNFADKRGECIYAACPHFDKCFIEKSVRKSKRADIVIANHALVMHQAAGASPDEILPSRYVFDEGHHLFEAADGAFGIHLNGSETADLRRWILGNETSGKSRLRGLKRRVEDIITHDDEAKADLEHILHLARHLPAQGWRQRLQEGQPQGPLEIFLTFCHQQVMARNNDAAGYYSLETEASPPVPGMMEAAAALRQKLGELKRPMAALVARLAKMLQDEAETLDTSTREKIQYVMASLHRRTENDLAGWIGLLSTMEGQRPDGAVDWLEITKIDGQAYDVGFYRAYTDPAALFAASLKPHAHGIAVTSASLRDTSEDDPHGWQSPITRTGAPVFATDSNISLFETSSPFDYAQQTKVFVIKDVAKDQIGDVAGAIRALFIAAGGGALGIFTAAQRLKAVHDKIVEPLEDAGLPLYAQHVDPLDTGTLIDIFREEENASLLGTDATRDGIDVPGRSLRLVVYDRVPWPRPTILHKARRNHFGRAYDDMLTRFKLKQAFGRLIRRHDDRGVFVMLDNQMPSRLLSAFPPGTAIERVGLTDALAAISTFLKEQE